MILKRLLFAGASCLILAAGIQFYLDSLVGINQRLFMDLLASGSW